MPRERHVRDASREAEEVREVSAPAIITAAICGAETTREMTPYLPFTAEELADEAVRCRDAGASVIHLHVRREDGTPAQDKALFQAALDAIRGRCDVIVQTSTGGAVGMSVESSPSLRQPMPEGRTWVMKSFPWTSSIVKNHSPPS